MLTKMHPRRDAKMEILRNFIPRFMCGEFSMLKLCSLATLGRLVSESSCTKPNLCLNLMGIITLDLFGFYHQLEIISKRQ